MKIGDKIIGFKFDDSYACHYTTSMDKYIGKEGTIVDDYIPLDSFIVLFDDGEHWYYPKKLCKKINKKNKID